jgi:hypothetical protein
MADVYRALVDADAVARRRAPTGKAQCRALLRRAARRAFRVSLTYDTPEVHGTSHGATDTHPGTFRAFLPR